MNQLLLPKFMFIWTEST